MDKMKNFKERTLAKSNSIAAQWEDLQKTKMFARIKQFWNTNLKLVLSQSVFENNEVKCN